MNAEAILATLARLEGIIAQAEREKGELQLKLQDVGSRYDDARDENYRLKYRVHDLEQELREVAEAMCYLAPIKLSVRQDNEFNPQLHATVQYVSLYVDPVHLAMKRMYRHQLRGEFHRLIAKEFGRKYGEHVEQQIFNQLKS